jgi:hypothetical protein
VSRSVLVLGGVGLSLLKEILEGVKADERSYFLAYEWLVQKHIRDNGVRRDEISPLWAVTYGGAAGFALWGT